MDTKISPMISNRKDEHESYMLQDPSKSATTRTTSSTNAKDKTIQQNQSKHIRIIQNFHLIWLDPHFDDSDDDFRNSINQLQTIFQTINTFNDIDQCVSFLTEIQREKTFMILSDSLARHILPLIHDLPQLGPIYILSVERSPDKQWPKDWSKVEGVFTGMTSIIESLKQETRHCDQNLVSISIVPSSVGFDGNLDKLDPSFMYTQILKEILLEVDYNEQSIKDLADYIREHYVGIQPMLNSIGQFEQTYYEHSSIWWYTCATFIYPMLNRALRNLEVDTIIKMAVFIRDLHLDIKRLHSEQVRDDHIHTLTVYRGQGMSIVEFEKMKNSPGGLLSFNNFLSTSSDKDVSFILAESATYDHDLIGILFRVQIDRSISSTPFALINSLSQYQSEEETLFSMNAIFRIGEITPLNDSNRLWRVDLTMTSDTDQQLSILADYIRNETKTATPGWYRLVPLLIKLGEFERAEQLCKILLQTTFQLTEKASIYIQLGYINDNLSHYTQAISSYKDALEIMQEILPSNHESFASTYNNIGLAYGNISEHSNALTFLEKGLEIYKQTLPPGHPYFVVIYNNIGLVYDKLGKQSEALSFYKRAVGCKSTLPENHPDLAIIYKNIGGIYNDRGEYSEALSCFEKSLQIEQKTLPPKHPSFATSYNHIGGIYKNMGEYFKARSYYEKALEISQKNYEEDHYDLAIGYNNIGSVYEKLGEYSEALSFYLKAHTMAKKILPPDHHFLITSHNNVGMAYYHLGQCSEALSFCEKALDICQRTIGPNHLDLALCLNNVGGMYHTSGEYSKALSFYERAREIQEKNLPLNHPKLAEIYTNIGGVYFAMKDHKKAIWFSEKGLDIRRRILSQYHPDLIGSYIGVAGPYLAIGRRSEAKLAYKNVIKIAEKSLPPDYPHLGLYKMMYALL